jgi:hypothetical protein
MFPAATASHLRSMASKPPCISQSARPTFYLGTHLPHWLASSRFPLFISHKRLARYKHLLVAHCRYAPAAVQGDCLGPAQERQSGCCDLGAAAARGPAVPGVDRPATGASAPRAAMAPASLGSEASCLVPRGARRLYNRLNYLSWLLSCAPPLAWRCSPGRQEGQEMSTPDAGAERLSTEAAMARRPT